ncbi:MAG: hypothetical protein QNL59_11885 [Actinomycetota bacterium]
MERLLIAAILVGLAVVVAGFLQRRKPAPPADSEWNIPVQLDRRDFLRPHAPWLVAVFTSSSCDACAGVWSKAVHLDAGPDGPVCAQELEAIADAEIHRRYGIDAVPLILIADADGVVQRHFLGPVTATDLWAAVAEAREPGSTPGSCETHD